MELYLLRHGNAVERTVGIKDRERPLTPKGRKKIDAIARRLLELEVSFDTIMASPFARARETAEILAARMNYKKDVIYSGNMLPGMNPKALARELQEKPVSGSSILLVGHEPDLSNLASFLICGTNCISIDLKKGGLCKLEVETFDAEGGATLQWLVPPSLLGV